MRGATYTIYGARLRVESDDGPALRSLMRLLDGFPALAEAADHEPDVPLSSVGEGSLGPTAEATSRMTLRFVARALRPPASALPLIRHGEVRLLGEGGRLWLADGWSRLQVDAFAGRAEGEVHPGSWSREQQFEQWLLQPGLLELLRGQGRFPLQATVLTAGRIAVLTVDGLARGAWMPADGEGEPTGRASGGQGVLLRVGVHGVTAGVWPAPAGPAPAGPRAGESPAAGGGSFTRLPSAAGGRAAEYRPAILLFPFEMPGSTRLEPALEREALAALVPASPLLLANPLLAPAHLGALRALVRQCRCYRLLHAPDLLRRPQAVADLLGALASA